MRKWVVLTDGACCSWNGFHNNWTCFYCHLQDSTTMNRKCKNEMRWKQVFFLKNWEPNVYFTVIYTEIKTLCHLKSTPIIIIIMFRLFRIQIQFYTHQVYMCIYVYILMGIWPQWKLDANPIQTLQLLYTTSCSYMVGDLVSVQEKSPSFICFYYFFFFKLYLHKKTTSIFQIMVCKKFLSKLSWEN